MTSAAFNQRLRHWLVARIPGQLVVQITDRCNARCPQCGMRISSSFKRRTLDKQNVYKTIDAAATRGIKAISFTGGEPMLMADTLCDYLNRAGQRGIPFIRTGTNGFFFTGSDQPGCRAKMKRLVEKLAATPVRNFWISLDSLDAQVHETMRGFDSLVAGMEKALPIFHDAGLFPSVNLGINRNLGGDLTRQLSPRDYASPGSYESAVYDTYCQAFSLFYQRVIDMGFTIVNACYPMSIDTDNTCLETVYQANATDHIVRFTPQEKKMIFMALRDTIPRFRSRIRIFTPRAALNALIMDLDDGNGSLNPFSAPCQGGINFFFIDARTGDTFPCGFRGGDTFGKLWEMAHPWPFNSMACRQCDWECFRDPSELMAPVLDLFTHPLSFIRKIRQDPQHLKMWAGDLRYYRICDYFNGRIPPDFQKMKVPQQT